MHTSKLTIALDAMGSDRAPKPEVEGAIAAARQYGHEIALIGPRQVVQAELAQHPAAQSLPIRVVHASEVIGMEEKAATAVRSKRDSSMRVGLRLVREGQAHAFISAGNTGAAMATAKMVLGALPGVDRPALAAVFPTETEGHACIMLDVGANVDCKPHNLEQFAIMGEIYARYIFRNTQPRVGLLSIGEEEGKGNELTREAYDLIKKRPLNFIGNVEGRDLYNAHVDVIVCDGFVGNVVLKTCEGVFEFVMKMAAQELLGALAAERDKAKQALQNLVNRYDYSTIGGAPLLGIDGICIICHGSSGELAIKNALGVAARYARARLNELIVKELASSPPDGEEDR
jgi:phosphate acyltransferase